MTTDMDVDMDIDMDLDLGPDPDLAALEAEAMRIDPYSTPQPDRAPTPNGHAAPHPPPADASQPAPHKVHLRGLDHFSTADITAWLAEHGPAPPHERVEWIDDTSANITYATPELGLQALHALTFADAAFDPTALPAQQLRPARRLSTHPAVELAVRQAVVGDAKRPRAYEASRFYLLHPDQDPRELRKQQRGPRDPHRQRRRRSADDGDDDDGSGGFRRRRFDDREHRRRRDQDGAAGFDVSMYDDDAGESSAGRPRRRRRGGSAEGYSSEEEGNSSRRPAIRGRGRPRGDLFNARAERGDGRLRDRSASPRGDGDGRHGFSEAATERADATAAAAASTSSASRRPPANIGKELFPTSAANPASVSALASPLASSSSPTAARELFPGRSNSAARRSRELFPHKTAISNHRRSDALDASETKELFSPGFAPSAAGGRLTGANGGGGRDLASRITLSDSPAPVDEDGDVGTSIRGRAAGAEQAPGFSILGAAHADAMESDGGGGVGTGARELFPLKTGGGNVGKELFTERIRGRGGPRRKAEDMFF